MNKLTEKRCVPCEGGVHALDKSACERLSRHLHARWRVAKDFKRIAADFEFKNYYHTTAFVNAVIYIAHREDHHPDITFTYKSCHIEYSTHAINGLSENDFICAAKIDGLAQS